MSVFLSSQKIIKDWIDYNDHMNVSYYLLIFDKYGADTLNNIFKMGEHSAKTTGKSTMIVESNITYNQELKVDDEVDVNLIYFDHDKKRLQYKMEMVHKEKKFLASTIEVLALYVDLNSRKVSEFETQHIEGSANYPLGEIQENISKINSKEKFHVHCAGGYRSVIAMSILKANGFDNLIDIAGGFNEIKKTDLNENCYRSELATSN